MGVEDETPFRDVADKSKGHYVISEDAKVLTDKFNTILNEVKTAKSSDDTAITLGIKRKQIEVLLNLFLKQFYFHFRL